MPERESGETVENPLGCFAIGGTMGGALRGGVILREGAIHDGVSGTVSVFGVVTP